MHANMMQTTQCILWIVSTLTQLKEGAAFEPAGSGKTFIKRAGLIVAPDMEAWEWMKANAGTEFFNERVVRILHASPERYSRK
jgi:hypothetical protein